MNDNYLIQCLIVEDNAAAIDVLKDLLAQISFVELVGVSHSAMEAIDFVRNQHVDLIFSDIQMNGMSGLDLVTMLKGKYHFIFISGYNKEQAADAYGLGVVDYIWKPVTLPRLMQALMAYEEKRSGENWRKRNSVDEKQEKDFIEADPVDFLVVRDKGKIIKLDCKKILYIQSKGDYLTVYTVDGKKLDDNRTLKEIAETLSGKGFLRVHNSHIVNIYHVGEIDRRRTNLWLRNGDKLAISRSHAKELSDEFDKWEGK